MSEIIHECQCAAYIVDKDREEWKIHHRWIGFISQKGNFSAYRFIQQPLTAPK